MVAMGSRLFTCYEPKCPLDNHWIPGLTMACLTGNFVSQSLQLEPKWQGQGSPGGRVLYPAQFQFLNLFSQPGTSVGTDLARCSSSERKRILKEDISSARHWWQMKSSRLSFADVACKQRPWRNTMEHFLSSISQVWEEIQGFFYSRLDFYPKGTSVRCC